MTIKVGTGGSAGSAGGDTYVYNSTSNCATIGGSSVVVGAKGGSGGGSSGGSSGSGGGTASGVGTTKNAGGAGGSATFGSGGAGGGGTGSMGAQGLIVIRYRPWDEDISSGLVGHWNFDEGSGSTANDSSSTNVDGTLMSCSAECYIYNDYDVNFDSAINVALNSSGGMFIDFRDEDRDEMNLAYNSSLADGNWHHVVAVRETQTTARLYIDGVSVDTDSNGSMGTILTEAGGTSPMIGAFNSGGAGSFFNGRIDDVRLYNRALTAGEIEALYNMAPEPLTCPANYVEVPPLAGYSSTAFCVAKYEMKDVGGVATSQAAGTPWVNITRGAVPGAGTAWKACQDLGAGYDLISNAQWQTIVRNIEGVAANWSGGSVGSGSLNRGHSDDTPANLLAANASDTNACSGTGQTCSDSDWDLQRRTHVLSNGSLIWDLAGNASEMLSDNYGDLGVNPAITTGFKEINTLSATNRGLFGPANSSLTSTNGVGQLYGGSGGIIIRGGQWHSLDEAGIFFAWLADNASDAAGEVGFRCVYTP